MRVLVLSVASLLASSAFSVQAGFTADFEDLSLPPDSAYNGSDFAGGFTSRGAEFNNFFDNSEGFDYWSGFAASTVNDPTTPGFGNQFASAAGAGAGGSATYGVAYHDQSGADTVTLPAPATVSGLFLNNTAYAALSMLNGGAFDKQFGGPTGSDPDWFMLTINGRGGGGASTGTVDVYLADFRAADSAQDFIMTEWTWVDLSSLGDEVTQLGFSLSSSDVGQFGMNTPAYFAVDNLTVIPEPSVLTLVLLGAVTGWVRHRQIC